MVTKRARLRFIRDNRGVTLLEGLLAMPIVLLILAAMIEFGTLMFQWNMTAKAMQIGARRAAVSTPARSDYDDEFEADQSGSTPGDAVPGGTVKISCGAGETEDCDSGVMNLIITGGDDECGDVGDNSVLGMCDVAPFLNEGNIRITYERTGLGYVGRPYGQVSTITVEAVDLTFDFFLLDDLIEAVTGSDLLGGIAIPAHTVAITSEDLDTEGDEE